MRMEWALHGLVDARSLTMPGAALPGSRLAVLAVGTRGDVQPLLALSIALQDSLLDCRITLVTHDAHRVSLRCMLHSCLTLSGVP